MSSLASADAEPAIATGIPTLAFYSHVEADVRTAARDAGVGLVVPRSRMAREGTCLVERLLEGSRSYGERPELDRRVEHRVHIGGARDDPESCLPGCPLAQHRGDELTGPTAAGRGGTRAARLQLGRDERGGERGNEPLQRALTDGRIRVGPRRSPQRSNGRPRARSADAMQFRGGRAENELGIGGCAVLLDPKT